MNHRLLLRSFRPCVTIGILSLAGSASAITAVWSDGTGPYNAPGNWTGLVAPVNLTDIGQISNAGTAQYDSGMNYSFGGIELGAGSGIGNFQMTGGTITTSTDIRVGGNAAGGGGDGFFVMSGGAITMAGGNFNIGFGTTARGRLELSGGSILVQTALILAVGNRGDGSVKQTGGSFQVLGNSNRAASLAQLGRNVTTGTGSGSYSLSGGSLTAAQLLFGNAVSVPAGSVNTFTLSGTGVLTVGTISIVNTNATNTFNFDGGTLIAENINLSLTNNGGTLAPADLDFANALAGSVPTDPTGTLTFGNGTSYTQNAGGILAVDIDGPGSNDVLNLGAALTVGNAVIGGTIAVNLPGGYDPAPGTTFDIVFADSVTGTAAITGTTPSGNSFAASKANSPDGREILRLTVVTLTPLALTQVGPLSGNSLPLTWTSDLFSVYRVDTSDDLQQWVAGSDIPGKTGTTTFVDTIAPGERRLFYKVVRVSP